MIVLLISFLFFSSFNVQHIVVSRKKEVMKKYTVKFQQGVTGRGGVSWRTRWCEGVMKLLSSLSFLLSLFLLLLIGGVICSEWESNVNIQAELKQKWKSLGIQYPLSSPSPSLHPSLPVILYFPLYRIYPYAVLLLYLLHLLIKVIYFISISFRLLPLLLPSPPSPPSLPFLSSPSPFLPLPLSLISPRYCQVFPSLSPIPANYEPLQALLYQFASNVSKLTQNGTPSVTVNLVTKRGEEKRRKVEEKRREGEVEGGRTEETN